MQITDISHQMLCKLQAIEHCQVRKKQKLMFTIIESFVFECVHRIQTFRYARILTVGVDLKLNCSSAVVIRCICTYTSYIGIVNFSDKMLGLVFSSKIN